MSALLERLALRALRTLPAEQAHHMTLAALKQGLAPKPSYADDARLTVPLLGQFFPNPIGIAAGFDKDGEVYNALYRAGFGFAEAGTVTPQPQPGNSKPRAFRLTEAQAVINRYGFNNKGVQALLTRLQTAPPTGILGLNVGANKTSEDKAADYEAGITALVPFAAYITVNISSPNTPGLRGLQVGAALDDLLDRVVSARDAAAGPGLPKPLLLKIAPDVQEDHLDAIVKSVQAFKIDGMIVSNTTLDRDAVKGMTHGREAGGLSGAPLFNKATIALAKTRQRVGPDMPLIGVGGISSGADAVQKLEAGANLIQLYTGLVFAGLGLVQDIKTSLLGALDKRGLTRVSALTSLQMQEWAAKPLS